MFLGIMEEEHCSDQKPHPPLQQRSSSATPSSSAAVPQKKKKRNLPGKPYTDAEVIALSPKTLMATNRFTCEVCNKGFQREQNLQLHRRGHNLPWKLKKKNPDEVRRRVYLCPEPTCAHHDPSRALGDLTGIKKHFCRKHGEKRWKCDKCSKRYAVQSDWKAHSKICGTREYRCDCGTLFSRRDSFVTHRAFCDALAQENARIPTGAHAIGGQLYPNRGITSHFSSLAQPSNDLLLLRGNSGADHIDATTSRQPQTYHPSSFYFGGGSNQGFDEDPQLLQSKPFRGMMQLQDLQTVADASSSSAAAAVNAFDLGFFSGSGSTNALNSAGGGTEPMTLFAGDLTSNHINDDANISSLYNSCMQPQISASSLLQKTTTWSGGNGSSLLRGFGTSYHSYTSGVNDGSRQSSGAHVENHFHDIMNSLASDQVAGFSGFNPGLGNMGEDGLRSNLSAGGIGGSDRSTRDFLGVDSMIRRNMVGGVQEREQHLGIGMRSMDTEMKSRGGRLQ
ncbi:protein indeterminate-domain 12 [Musa acuminata AAA Group]|uniref:protein indeterminate-domain 12 n=1 Tax=Musa acuminata AAA Group TaxID=214697 RepID=UPI0031D6D1C4